MSCKNIIWSDSYLIGDTIIDNEHKKLFALTEKLFHSTNEKDEIISIIKELVKYTKFHFAHEEQFMQSINFKYFDEHKQLHANIVEKLNQYIQQKDNINSEGFAQKLALFVQENIVNHILTEDKRVHHSNKETSKLKDLFQWKDTYKINNQQIDQEHKKLFELARKALDTPLENKKEHIRKILIELNEYMKEHFTNEELYMKKIGFPEYEPHKELHEKIIVQMNEFIKMLPKLSFEQFERRLIEYMDVWLINHIITQDHKIICFQNSLQN